MAVKVVVRVVKLSAVTVLVTTGVATFKQLQMLDCWARFRPLKSTGFEMPVLVPLLVTLDDFELLVLVFLVLVLLVFFVEVLLTFFEEVLLVFLLLLVVFFDEVVGLLVLVVTFLVLVGFLLVVVFLLVVLTFFVDDVLILLVAFFTIPAFEVEVGFSVDEVFLTLLVFLVLVVFFVLDDLAARSSRSRFLKVVLSEAELDDEDSVAEEELKEDVWSANMVLFPKPEGL